MGIYNSINFQVNYHFLSIKSSLISTNDVFEYNFSLNVIRLLYFRNRIFTYYYTIISSINNFLILIKKRTMYFKKNEM